MSLSVLNGARSSGDPFWEFLQAVDRPRYTAQCGVCGRRLCYRSSSTLFHQPHFNLRSREVQMRPPPAVREMPHPIDFNVGILNPFEPPENQPSTSAVVYQPRGALDGSAMIRAPNPSNGNYGYPTSTAITYQGYYENPASVFAPDMRSQYNIQIRIPNIDDPLMEDTFVVTENISNTSEEENSDETEEGQEIGREKCDARLRKWIVTSGHPLSIIEKKEFTEFMNEVNPSYILPTVEELKSDMRADYLKFSETVRQKLLDPVSVCITAESLISQNDCQYLAMTAHYIDREFNGHSILFDCCRMVRFDRTTMVSTIDMALAKFYLTGRVTTFVSDNKAIVQKMFADNYDWIHFGCYGLELKEIAEELKQLAIQFFEMYCPTIRVNSDAYLQDVIETVAKVLPTLRNLIEETNICVDIIKVLQPFEELILFVGNRHIWTSEFVLINRSLVTAYEKLVDENFSEDIKKAVQTVLEKLTRLTEYEYIPSLAYATFLDPRYKNTVFSNSDEALSIKETFIEEVTSMCKPKRLMPAGNNEENATDADRMQLAQIASIFNDFDTLMEESQDPVRAAVDEVNRYMETAVVPRHEDPLTWWADNVYQFPHLAKMAATHLNMQITSVPFDQIFTDTGKNMQEKRNRYDTACLPMITFLSANPQFMDKILNDQ